MVICLEQGADLHIAQLMPLPLTVSCFSKIQIGFTFLVPAHPGSPKKGLLNRGVCETTMVIKKLNLKMADSCRFQNPLNHDISSIFLPILMKFSMMTPIGPLKLTNC